MLLRKVMSIGLWVVVWNLLRTSINYWSLWHMTWKSSKWQKKSNQKLSLKASMLSNIPWNTHLSWTNGAWYKSLVIMTYIFPKTSLCACLMDLRQRSIKEIILLPIKETSSNTKTCNWP